MKRAVLGFLLLVASMIPAAALAVLVLLLIAR